MNKICIIGDIIVDVTLKNQHEDLKMRLGGIVHSARALWAISKDYGLAYIAPSYLDSRIESFLKELGSPIIRKIAETTNAPNIMLIEEAREIGNQGYDFILREQIEYVYNEINLDDFNHFLIIAGQFNLEKILFKLENKKVSLEMANLPISELEKLNFKFETIYVSTSCNSFTEFYKKDDFNFEDFANQFEKYCNKIILKENRGGTRLFNFEDGKIYQVSSQTKSINHSVGVGDVFNAIFESNMFDDIDKNLAFSSFVALEYASTTYPENFKKSVQELFKVDIEDLVNIKGTIINWEKRKKINIYIAAPDFNFVNTEFIEKVDKSLLYHNFTPRRPVKENGQMEESDSEDKKQKIYHDDLKILNECQILIAILLYNDPGTLVEIGIASERRIPVLLFDPYNIAKNCMLVNSCDLVTNNLDDIISEVFILSSRL